MAPPVPDAIAGALRKRIASAVVLGVLAISDILAGGIAFALLIVIATWICAWEWARLCGISTGGDLRGAMALLCLIAAPTAAVALVFLQRPVYALAVTLAVAVFGAAVGGDRRWALAGGVLYLALPALCLVWLRQDAVAGLELVLWLFAVVWATDVGAFAFGRMIGGPKLAPAISPGKTWAGLAGGVASAGIVAMLMTNWNGGALIAGAGVAAVLAVVSQLGDLFESSLKRRARMKDSGTLIPGHGGALDRLDGLLAAAPALALIVLVAQHGFVK